MATRPRRPSGSYRFQRHMAGGTVRGMGLDGRVTGPAGAWDDREAQVLARARQVHRALMRITPR